jgi:hypothetical protein
MFDNEKTFNAAAIESDIYKDFDKARKEAFKLYGPSPYPQFDGTFATCPKLAVFSNFLLKKYGTDDGFRSYLQHTVMALWQPTKRIFEVDNDVANELLESTFTGEIPLDQIRLPDWSIAVKCGNLKFRAAKVRMRYSDISKDILILVHENGWITTISLTEPFKLDTQLDESGETAGLTRQVISALLYLGSVHNTVPSSNFGAYRSANKKKKIKPFEYPTKVTCVQIGVELGERLRNARTVIELTGSTVKPHIRRAHWHNYWTGPKDSRKLICKWTNSTGVNMNLADV